VATTYRIDIYRIGYYNGDGARKVDTIASPTATSQQPCSTDADSGLVDCGNWSVSATWTVPTDAVSGVYIAHLVSESGGSGESHIPFVVRNDASHSAVLFQTSDTTWQAYNQYGGKSLYVGGPGSNPDRAYKVSYNRPFTTRGDGSQDAFFNAEYPMVRWLERNGYDVSYMSGLDSDRRGELIKNHKIFLSVGHDEYWSGTQRANVEAARDAGTTNLAFLSGNEVFWKTRWESSIDGSGTPNRTLVCYKDTHSGLKIDTLLGAWTGTWRDPMGGAYDAGRPENALTGQFFKVNAGTTAINVPAAYGKWPLWRDTNIATGTEPMLAPDTLGYEWDENFNGSQPSNSIDLSATSASGLDVLEDYGHTYGSGSAEHHLNLYRAPSGSLVFGAGTVQWSWGLDSNHDRGSAPEDVRMQQATANLLTDMGAQASTLQSGLKAPTPMNPMFPTGTAPPPPPPPPPPTVVPNASGGEVAASNAKPSAAAAAGKDGSASSSGGQGSTVSNAGCLKLTTAVTRLRIGRRTVLRATVRRGGRAVAGVRVVLSGGSKTVVRRSDRHGRVSFSVRPRHAGTMRLRGPSQRKSCKAAAASIRVR